MSFIAENTLTGVVGVPVCAPQVELVAQSPGLPVAQVQLAAGQVLNVPYLSLHFIGFRTLGFLEKVNTGLPTVYVGIYYQTNPDVLPARPIIYTGLEAPGISVLRRSSIISFTAPGTYRVLLVNNHVSSNISALVSGVAYVTNVVTSNG